MTAPDEVDLASLPPELRALLDAERATRRALEQELAALAEQNRRLEHLVREFRQALHGRKSEKLGTDERQLAFEDLETAVAAVETAKAAASATRSGRVPREPRSGAIAAGCRRSCRASSASSSPKARFAPAAAGRWPGSGKTAANGSTSPPPSSG